MTEQLITEDVLCERLGLPSGSTTSQIIQEIERLKMETARRSVGEALAQVQLEKRSRFDRRFLCDRLGLPESATTSELSEEVAKKLIGGVIGPDDARKVATIVIETIDGAEAARAQA